MRFQLRSIARFLVLAVTALAAHLKVGSLNCYLPFDPAIDHRGKVDDANRTTGDPEKNRVVLPDFRSTTARPDAAHRFQLESILR